MGTIVATDSLSSLDEFYIIFKNTPQRLFKFKLIGQAKLLEEIRDTIRELFHKTYFEGNQYNQIFDLVSTKVGLPDLKLDLLKALVATYCAPVGGAAMMLPLTASLTLIFFRSRLEKCRFCDLGQCTEDGIVVC